jgi:DNA polymerase epsilon subunit 2
MTQELSLPQQKRLIFTAFKKRGLSLAPPALTALINILKHQPNDSTSISSILTNILDEIKERLMEQDIPSLVVSSELLQKVVVDMTRDERDVMDEAMQLLDLKSGMPKLVYEPMKKRFTLDKNNGGRYFGDVDDKVDMLLQRYVLIHQRLMRNEAFKPRLTNASSSTEEAVKITPIEGLLGTSGTKILLGMIVQVEEGRYYLEDPSAQVLMDLSEAEVSSEGFITENSICLVEGEMLEGVLKVQTIGQPIYESRTEAIDAIGLQNSDIFGAIPTLSELAKLNEQEIKHGPEGDFIILSDVHLDDIRVLENLTKLLEGFQDYDPLPVFVLMGDFASKYPSAHLPNANSIITGFFDDLASIICKFPKIAKEGRFILVPSQNDPGLGSILPRPPIPNFFTSGLRSKVKHVHLASNPCRLRYFSKELVIGRVNVLSQLRRNCILPLLTMDSDQDDSPKKDKNDATNPLVNHAIKTMLDQGHLCPVPLSSLPIYWQNDHIMRLYPPPDAIILGDKSSERYYETYKSDCDVMNPGSFCADGGFLVFRPIDFEYKGAPMKSEVEFSQIE